MRAHLTRLLYSVHTSFWFLPILMVSAALALAVAALHLDRSNLLGPVAQLLWFRTLDLDSARPILSTIAGAMITTASLVFSLTLVSLTLASQQLGPRLLSTFLRDRMTQCVLGLFLATFVYALVVLTAIGSIDVPGAVPMLSMGVAIGSTIASFVALILFIHHLSTSLQADVVVARVCEQLRGQLEHYFPERGAQAAPIAPDAAARPAADGVTIVSPASGYIQAIDREALLQLAVTCNLQIQVLRRPGHFMAAGEAVAVVHPKSVDPGRYRAELNRAIVHASKRTPAQDPEFALMAIVEIALRALSPGINDPHTANTCVDRLGEALRLTFEREARTGLVRDGDGAPRLFEDVITVGGLVDTALDEIRQCAGGSVSVLVRLAEALRRLAFAARTPQQADAVRRHCAMLLRASRRQVHEPEDLECIESVLRLVPLALDGADARLRAAAGDAGEAGTTSGAPGLA